MLKTSLHRSSKMLYVFLILGCILHLSSTNVQASIKLPSFDCSNISYVLPASAVSQESMRKICKLFPCTLPLFKTSALPYHSGTDAERFLDLKKAIYDKKKKYIWAVRGGYGSARLLDFLTKIQPPEQSKVIIGYSDITFLHLFFDRWGWKGIHGAMPSDLAKTEVNEKNFTDLIKIISRKPSQALELRYNKIKALNKFAAKCEKIDAQIIGGNLTILENSLGTSWQVRAKGRILFIEECGEDGYCIDRRLTHLKQAGALDGARAILVGSLSNCGQQAQFAIERFAKDVQIPVFQVDCFGHGRDNFPLIFGAPSSITRKNYQQNVGQKDFRSGREDFEIVIPVSTDIL
ncbi:LD-carboxypeptidase [Rickettsiales endosymbiont of Paramecium tredecaurelia]|uniref:LD-carboxypeptidase n=1 Tax=Candidatus Sarmatiella mevalonica TaxID=2770581 RepID=UPI001921BE46|nr:LD-carboxypeptidase [Candidatus Sarmatiella mevalonica]MBL3284717.1 LD-carboxypeptidase [Candidatus Sarmatiella mevalonica]